MNAKLEKYLNTVEKATCLLIVKVLVGIEFSLYAPFTALWGFPV